MARRPVHIARRYFAVDGADADIIDENHSAAARLEHDPADWSRLVADEVGPAVSFAGCLGLIFLRPSWPQYAEGAVVAGRCGTTKFL